MECLGWCSIHRMKERKGYEIVFQLLDTDRLLITCEITFRSKTVTTLQQYHAEKINNQVHLHCAVTLNLKKSSKLLFHFTISILICIINFFVKALVSFWGLEIFLLVNLLHNLFVTSDHETKGKRRFARANNFASEKYTLIYGVFFADLFLRMFVDTFDERIIKRRSICIK